MWLYGFSRVSSTTPDRRPRNRKLAIAEQRQQRRRRRRRTRSEYSMRPQNRFASN